MKKSKHKTRKPAKSLQDYYESIDFYGWWEDFSLTYSENGQHKYITVHSFIKKKTSDTNKRAFLWWILGPKDGEPRKAEYKTFPQFDWEYKRGVEFWCSNKNIEDIRTAASNRASGIDEVKAIGSFNLDSMTRIKMLSDQLDREFGGRLQLPNLSAKENDIRLNNFLSLRSKLQAMLHSEQMMFAKTRSVDMAQLDALLQVIGPSLIGQVTTDAKLDADTQAKVNAFGSLNQMILQKASDWSLKLPDKDMEDIVRKGSKPMLIDRKQKVN